MPTRQGANREQNSRNFARVSFRVSANPPSCSIPCTWKTFFAKSTPILINFLTDGLPVGGAPATTSWHLMPLGWGRPHHHREQPPDQVRGEAIQTWGLRRRPSLDRVAVARDDERAITESSIELRADCRAAPVRSTPRQLAGSAVDLMEASFFRSLEAVNGARSRAASGGRRP